MSLSAAARRVLAGLTGLVLAFLYAPIAYVALLAFNRSRSIIFSGFTLKWWGEAWRNDEVRAVPARPRVSVEHRDRAGRPLGRGAAP